jgi:hypothetical protein
MMLRKIALALIGLVTFASLVGIVMRPSGPAFYVWLIWSAIGFAGLVFERYRYKPIAGAAPERGWERTGERFVDPETGRPVEVQFNARTGERRYVQTNNMAGGAAGAK